MIQQYRRQCWTWAEAVAWLPRHLTPLDSKPMIRKANGWWVLEWWTGSMGAGIEDR